MSGYLDARNVRSTQIPHGYSGTTKTIARMHDLVALAVRGIGPDGLPDDRLVRRARGIVMSVPAKSYLAEASAILSWCQANLRYVRDPYLPGGLERLQHPNVTIFEGHAGDCDDLSMAFSALAAAIGCPWAFRTVGQNPLAPREFLHVYSLVNVGDAWLPADPSFPAEMAPLGWEPPFDALAQRLGVPATGIGVTSRQDWLPE